METNELLVNALCGYMPHRVMVELKNDKDPYELLGFHCNDKNIATIGLKFGDVYATQKVHLDEIKPYLRPMSSMTDKENDEFSKIRIYRADENGCLYLSGADIDWLNERHFDYRGLIEQGLALPAPDGMYNLKQ